MRAFRLGGRRDDPNETVFEMSTTGANYRVLHNFGSSYDGSNPYPSVIAVGSELYGTTEDGGSDGSGTVFELSTSGKESILHSFKGYADGTDPLGGLIDVKGTLYGTTSLGGAKNSGTIFEVTP